jgi:hypothetical protein
MTAIAALLRHRTTNLRRRGFWEILRLTPQVGGAIGTAGAPNDGLAGLAGRGLANFDVVIAHD